MIKRRFKEYFTFTKKERNGIIVLLLILFILVIIQIFQNTKSVGTIELMDEQFQKDIEAFEKGLLPKEQKNKTQRTAHQARKTIIEDKWHIPNKLFRFDPNTVSKTQLKDLGFSNRQLNTLMNYRKSGGRFFEKKDLMKIYGINIKQYKALESYIVINEQKDQLKENVTVEEEVVLIELNSSSKEELKRLRGIGDAYAERIVKYKSLLGGYYSREQLLEVYGMDSARFAGFHDQVIIDTNKINRINLNTATYDSLIKHPYLNRYQTKAILKYKEIVGEFTKTEQIYQNNLLTKEEFLRIRPYLKLK
ncbi:MAG: helix-hairpin-helix domain-containing protein [Bacteroidetes bacterium]|nr:helix-hairpin-helix domain-containing protein [Bacteroidota bacterium]